MLAACGTNATKLRLHLQVVKELSKLSVKWLIFGTCGVVKAKLIERIIAEYNKSQDKCEVVETSTPDQKVIITSIPGGSEGPDITDDFGGSVPKYANENVLRIWMNTLRRTAWI